MGQGQRARGATEHVIQMIRGDVACLGSDTKTWFEGAGGEHSQKPVEFYNIVEKLTPAPHYFELFSRGQPRESWDLHGNEVGKIPAAIGADVIVPVTEDERQAERRASANRYVCAHQPGDGLRWMML